MESRRRYAILIDRQFVTSVMKALCEEPTTGRPPNEETKRIKDTLKAFYEAHYKPFVVGQLDYRHINMVWSTWR